MLLSKEPKQHWSEKMITDSFYVNQDTERALEVTELAQDELEDIVGRFAKHSRRAGQLRGEVCIDIMEQVFIRHAFTKKVLWRKND